MPRHPALPEKKTDEELAVWLTENAIDKRIHSTETQITEKERHEYEHKVTAATAALYDLQALEKSFKKTIKDGTDMALSRDGKESVHQPQTFTIPPTKGTAKLEENRQYADRILKQGFTVENTEVFGIPYGEKKTIVFVDIEGNKKFDEPMTPEQVANVGRLFDGEETVEGVAKKFRSDMKDLEKKHNVKVSAGTKKDNMKPLFPDKEDTSASALFPEANPLDA